MTIDLVYIVPCDERDKYAPYVQRFFDTYDHCTYLDSTNFKNHSYRLNVVFTNGEMWSLGNPMGWQGSDPFEGSYHKLRYFGPGRDIGVFQMMAHQSNADMLLCCNTRAYFKRPGWLNRFIAAWEQFGPGLYGASASREHCPLLPPNTPNMNPHIRTSCFACPPAWLREYPAHIRCREDGYRFESGEQSFTKQQVWKNRMVAMVTWDRIVSYPFTQHILNGYRNGDQSALIAFDRATEEYDTAAPVQRKELERLASV